MNKRMIAASSDCMELTYSCCKLETTPSPFLTIICALDRSSIILPARNLNISDFAVSCSVIWEV